MKKAMKKAIYPCLWFDGNAREAAEYYCSVFDNTVITSDNQMVVNIESSGQKFMFLNGGPEFHFNPSVSFFVVCNNEAEINKAWDTLIVGGSVMMPLDNYVWSKKYGWVQDRFGINWQLSFAEPAVVQQKFTPSIMFTGKQFGKAEEAVNFYTSVFEESSVMLISKYKKEDNDVEGTVNHAQFRLRSRVFMAMDSSNMHNFSFNEAISFVVECDTQKEIDFFWNILTEGGEESQCGWLKDKYGVSWQIIPSVLNELMSDPIKSDRVVNAFLKMKKFDIEKLVNA
jgi:predicted 3-demethylubiquinone-9 3-methyltransferase (glyoxalase superfamily)